MADISIIIPALNEAQSIGETLDAAARLKGDVEVIVVDGGAAVTVAEIALAEPFFLSVKVPRASTEASFIASEKVAVALALGESGVMPLAAWATPAAAKAASAASTRTSLDLIAQP